MKQMQFKLANNLSVILVPMPGVKSITSLVLGNTGSRFETKAQWGLAHFFEHMVFKGTKKYPTPMSLATTLDSVGAQSNAFTSKEYTGYYIKSASRHLDLALDVLAEMMFAPLLKDEDIERERGVIVEEINMYLDTPMQYIGNVFEQMIYAGSGLEHDIIGTKKSIAQFQSADFRKFLRQWYGPANLTLVVAGDAQVLRQPQTVKQIESHFGVSLPSRQNQRQPTQTLAAQEPAFSQKRMQVVQKKTEQTHLILAWPGISLADSRRYALSLLATIMGGNMSSRLFTEVREKRGLCYYVRSDVDQYHNTGSFGASAGVDPHRVHQAVEVIIDQFNQLASGQKPITAAELNRAQEYLTGNITLSLEDSRSLAQWFGLKDILLHQTETPTEVLKKLKAVKLTSVNQLAQELIQPDAMRLALIGPFKAEEFRSYVS